MFSPITYMIIRSSPIPKIASDTCPICKGLGKVGVKRDDKTPDGTIRSVLEEVDCSNCNGTGKLGGTAISDKPQINSNNVHGEPWTGYEDGENKGEFECENCTHYERETSSCNQQDMVLHSSRPKVAGSDHIIVSPEGCCAYNVRIGLEDKDKS